MVVKQKGEEFDLVQCLLCTDLHLHVAPLGVKRVQFQVEVTQELGSVLPLDAQMVLHAQVHIGCMEK